MTRQDVATRVCEKFGPQIVGQNDFRDETTFSVPLGCIRDLAAFCRDELGFDYLIDICSLDHFGDFPRYEMVYELYAMDSGLHLRLKALVPDDVDPVAPTVSDIWPTADWHEREVYDMMGIKFGDHPDLRRILMWDGYPYHPLRKDFPLEGKHSDTPDVAFSDVAPLAGGPFVTVPTPGTTVLREPRARHPGEEPPTEETIA